MGGVLHAHTTHWCHFVVFSGSVHAYTQSKRDRHTRASLYRHNSIREQID